MPEMKRNFTGGKMNKDLDTRLVPPGQYRDAMNIQVSTSEGSNVGTVQNILGNNLGCTYLNNTSPIPNGSYTVGSISDEKNDDLYWMVAGPDNAIEQLPLSPGNNQSFKDMIIRKKSDNTCEPVFVDKHSFLISNDVDPGGGLHSFIEFSDVNLYSNVTAGMFVTGYNLTNPVFTEIPVTNVGFLSTPSFSYESVPDLNNTAATVTTHSVMVEMFKLIPFYGYNGPPYEWYQTSVNYVYLDNYNGEHISNIIGDTFTLLPGSPQQQIFTITAASNVSLDYGGGFGQLAVKIELDGYIVPFDPEIAQNVPSYIVQDNALGPLGVASTYQGLGLIGTITSIDQTSVPPSSDIEILANSFNFIEEAYNNLQSGLNLTIDNSIGAGVFWPQNTCVDPASVNLNNDFQWSMINCDTGLPVVPLVFSDNPLTFFITGSGATTAIHLEEPVFLGSATALLFESKKVLNFNRNRLVTGINIIDDMLFWTDNFSEPKKINIPRSIQGTYPDGNTHTNVINNKTGLNINNSVAVKEENVTVIKKSPKQPLTIDLNVGRDENKNYTGITRTVLDPGQGINESSIISSSNNTVVYNFGNLAVGDTINFEIQSDASGSIDFDLNWNIGSIILLKEFNLDNNNNATAPAFPLSSYAIRGVVRDWQYTSFVSNSSLQNPNAPYGNQWPDSAAGTAHVKIEVLGLNGAPPTPPDINTPLDFIVDLELQSEAIFENKFPRFSYRYKYEDGEYSTFAPFSQVAFAPSTFNYDPQYGWNTGMINNVREIKVKNFKTGDLPSDVTEIDILYKEDASPNIYIVETISPMDPVLLGKTANAWNLNEYNITSEAIKATVSSNQLLRSFDNVPVKALAQEVVGNRIVYGNYEHNFDLTVGNFSENYKPNFKNHLVSADNTVSGGAYQSIKSLRDYKLGVVFTDNYGRETPILISESGGFKVDKKDSVNANKLLAGLIGQPPNNLDYFKFFIKETSTEYYNLAMDRWYQAEDGNIWLAFPSSDRNKVDIDTTLFLKKGDDNSIENNDKYKILSIENEAPEFIKTRKIRIGTATHNSGRDMGNNVNGDIFGSGLANAPRYNAISFNIGYDQGGFAATSMSDLDSITEDLYIKFIGNTGSSSEYKISEITSNGKDTTLGAGTRFYFVTLARPLQENDISFIFDNAASPSQVQDGIKIQFTKAIIENSPKFDGRFFAKIPNDGRIKLDITDGSQSVEYIEAASKTVYLLDDDITLKSRSLQTWYNNADANANPNIYFNNSYPVNWIDNDYSVGSPTGLDNNDVNNNPNGENWSLHNARQAYFGQTLLQPGYNPNGSFSNVRFPDPVWFINKSTQVYSQSFSGENPNQLFWGQANNMDSFSNNPGNGGGIVHSTNFSTMNLAVGGIGYKNYTDDWGLHNALYHDGAGNYSATLPTFFGVGQDNENYNDAQTTEFTRRVNGGFSFWWKEDPTKTIYTVQGVNYSKWVRWGREDDGGVGVSTAARNKAKMLIGSPASYHKNFNFSITPAMDHWDPAAPVGTAMSNGLKLGKKIYTSTGVTLTSANPQTITLSDTSNLQVNMTVFNSSGNVPAKTRIIAIDHDNNVITVNKQVTTSASQTLEIGYTIRYVSSDVASDMTNVWIKVDDIHAECEVNGSRYVVQKGMRLSSWNDGDETATNAIVKSITQESDGYKIQLTGYTSPLVPSTEFPAVPGFTSQGKVFFEQVSMNSVSNNTEYNSDLWSDNWDNDSAGIGAVGYTMQMIEPVDEYTDGGILPPDPYVWETEPKENTDLDIYYEISENNPISLNPSTIKTAIPVNSKVTSDNGGLDVFSNTTVVDNAGGGGNVISISNVAWIGPGTSTDASGNIIQPLEPGDKLKITRPSGVEFEVEIEEIIISNQFKLKKSLYNSDYLLNWHNCYSFGNGVESNRIRDNFNLPFISNGVKASTTLDQEYKKERRKYGLIYSGLYNSTSGINNLNQFIAAEKITKDVNPTYGSIQKLHTRDSDLIALCEDKVLKILANKDAVFNADGNPQLTANENVLGQTIPFVGDFGISTNPESFASESYRAYFADKVRGSIVRLSRDGITPISDHGMKDWFRDYLSSTNLIIGSYDDRKYEYNVTLHQQEATESRTVSFKEDVKGWVSFKSFIPENAISCANDYYSFKDGELWKHHVDTILDNANNEIFIPRNTFYGLPPTNSSVKVILNDAPSTVKSFHTINYEGSQSKVNQLLTYNTYDPNSWDGSNYNVVTNTYSDNQYYNDQPKDGWYVQSVRTNQEEGSLNEFIEKEGKWFNFIKGKQ